jgi:DNA (cytosine-5)-methyltransferase 1
MSKLKVLELFSGIGALTKALERLGIEHEIVDAVEIDKYAVKSFNAIHNTNFEPQDICEWDKDIEVDLIMHGSPCQSISLAGLQHGADKGSGTRSSLMWETVRIVEKLKPKYVIWENVKNLLSKKHKHNFDAYLETMEKLGYTNYYQVLNAKDYGIPQNRERVFTISILGNENYTFPKGEENNNKIDRLFNFSARQDCRVVYDENGLCPTLVAGMGAGGGKVPMFIEKPFEFPQKQELKLKLKDMLEDEVDEKYYLSDIAIDKITRHKNKIIENENPDESSTLHAGYYKMGGRDQQYIKDNRIRKLTPKECWRLMGFDDVDFEKASKANSNTQLYKQAGNSIVVNVLEAILTNLLK